MAQHFELGEPKVPDSVAAAGDGDERGSMYSSCGSLSFVITDDGDIEKIPEPVSTTADTVLNSYMTQSQYAQVVFQDIADRYPNDKDLVCLYTLTGSLQCAENDRIGVYRVPYFAPHDYVTFKWVTPDMALDGNKKTYSAIFDASALPKDEDFYQFQYLRSDQVLGASVPFQLRSGEELYTIEDDEFMRVDRETDVAHRSLIDKFGLLTSENQTLKAQIEELENKCKELTTQCDEMKEEFKTKNESIIVLEEKYKSYQDTSSNEIEQLKTDFAFALQDKLLLEERLHKGQKALKELQTERDLLSGEAHQLQREKRIMEEEILAMAHKMDDDRNMFMATSKAKEMAVNEIKAVIVKNDDLQKRVDRLTRELDVTSVQNEDLQMVLESLRTKFENLEMSKENEEKQKDLIIADLESKLENIVKEKDEEIEKLQNQVALKQKEFEVLSLELVTRSKSKFQQIDTLKKQLSEAERSLNKYINGPVSNSGPASVASVLESLSQLEITDETTSESPLRLLEARIHALHSEFKEVEKNHAVEIRNIRDELESLRSNTMTRSFSSSVGSNDSRRMLESQIINQQIAMASQTQTETERESMASQTDSITSHKGSMTSTITIEDDDECVIVEGATAYPSTPAMVGAVAPPLPPPRTKPVILAPPRFQVPSGPSSPPNSAMGVVGPDQGIVFQQFWPKSEGSVFTNSLREQQQQQQQASNIGGRLPEPLVPLKVGSQPTSMADDSACDEEFSALAEWAKGSFMPKATETAETCRDTTVVPIYSDSEERSPNLEDEERPNILLTDDGRTLEAPKEDLTCPFCQKEYQRHEVERLQLHVESHMERTLTCPICETTYELKNGDREEYQLHVQSHFPEDTDFVQVAQQPQQQQEEERREPRDRFWFLDFD